MDVHDAGTILVVEADEQLLSSILDVLAESRLPAVAARDAAQAEAAAEAQRISLVLLDFHLAGQRSDGLGQRLRAQHGGQVRLVVLTGDTDPEGARRSTCSDDFLRKPFTIASLLAVIARHGVG